MKDRHRRTFIGGCIDEASGQVTKILSSRLLSWRASEVAFVGHRGDVLHQPPGESNGAGADHDNFNRHKDKLIFSLRTYYRSPSHS